MFRSLKTSYNAVGDSKVRVASQYPFEVKKGYQYAKIWVHALKGSSEIRYKVRVSATSELIIEFTVEANHIESQIISLSPGNYFVSLSSEEENKMNGQFNVRVSKTIEALRK